MPSSTRDTGATRRSRSKVDAARIAEQDARIAESRRRLVADVAASASDAADCAAKPKLKRWRRELREAQKKAAEDAERLRAVRLVPPSRPKKKAAAPAPAPAQPSPPSRKVSLAKVKRCFREIMAERPDDPPNEPWLLAEMKARLGTSPGRQRVRHMWKQIAPHWKRPVGHPRNNISAKNSAA
jgi:hypothetical protein